MYSLHYEQFHDGTVKCIEDEIPFELPDGWVWSRLGNLSSAIQYGLSNSAEQSGTHHLLRITDIQNGNVNWDAVPFTTVENASDYLLSKGDILFARTGATVGKSFLIDSTPFPAVYASYLIRIRLLSNIVPEYVYQFFNSQCYWEQITDKSVGVGQPNCNGTSLKELFIPLPPQSEQARIVPMANSVLNYIISIETQKDELKTAISSLKSQILDLAIRGKLVPQNPDDEPASVLLERIRSEKEELIKQGKIKRDKKESVIFKGEDNSYYEKIGDTVTCIDNELPFEIPDNWSWCRLQSICEPITDGTHQTPIYSNNGYVFLSAKNVTTGSIDWDNVMYIPESLHKELYSRISPRKGDILLAKNGTIGVAAIVDRDCEFDIYVTLALLRTVNHLISPHYLLRAIGSATVQSFFKGALIGIGVPNLHLVHIRQALIPIPPITEQERLANEMKKLFEILSNIEKSLS